VPAHETNEGEGDLAYLPAAFGGTVLAGHGFRTVLAAHAEVQEALGRPVLSLHLVDPRFYHLDVALAALDDANIPVAAVTTARPSLDDVYLHFTGREFARDDT
jgi:N-dimethylarginine dimethylaminohydrolase